MKGDRQWWCSDPDDVARDLATWTEYVERQQLNRYETYLRNAALYDPTCDFYDGGDNEYANVYDIVAENIVKTTVDTFQSILGKDRPRIRFQTDGANFRAQRKARSFARFIDGEFQRLEVHALKQGQIRDAALFGTGFVRVDQDGDTTYAERVLPDEIVVDNKACRSAPPNVLVQRKFVNKSQLAARIGKHDKKLGAEIEAHSETGSSWAMYREMRDDEVVLMEGWKLPSYEGADDGRRVLAIPGLTLVDEPWTRCNFPFDILHWTKPITGFYGLSMVEEIAGIQMRVHSLNEFIDAVHDRIAVPRVFVNQSDMGVVSRIDNTIGAIIPVRGGAPTFETPRPVSPDTWQRLDQLKRAPYEVLGITQLQTQGAKPIGLESAPSLREYHDISNDRFSVKMQEIESSYKVTAQLIIYSTKELTESGKNPVTAWRTPWNVVPVKWSDVDPKEDLMHMDLEAASILSKTPAGRKQDLIEMTQAGWITADKARQLSGLPDLEADDSLANAAMEYNSWCINQLEDRKRDSDPIPAPDELADLKTLHSESVAAYLRAMVAGADEVVLSGFRSFIGQTQFLIDQLAERQAILQMEQQANLMQLQGAMMPAPVEDPMQTKAGVVYPKGDLAPGTPEGL